MVAAGFVLKDFSTIGRWEILSEWKERTMRVVKGLNAANLLQKILTEDFIMSYADGWAAINLEKPARVPRTEYSIAEYHWPLIRKVTGIEVYADSPPELRRAATRAMRAAWTYDFAFNTPVGGNVLSKMHTSMGHAVYAEDGGDYRYDMNCPFSDPEEVIAFDPWAVYGKVGGAREWLEASYADACAYLPEEVNMTGTYVTVISGMIEIFGWEMLLLSCGTDPKGFGEMVNRYANWFQQYFDAIAESNIPLVMVHDDMVWTGGAFAHPAWYRKYVFPNYKKYIRPLLDAGKKVIYISDGNYTEFIDDIANCGFNGFVLEPMTDMKYIAEKYGKTHCFIGNADTRILLSGSKDDIYAEVKRCMDIGKDCPGFFMAVGNHIPANTPIESCLIYEEAYRKYCMR